MGELLDRLPDDTVVILMSDHGFGGASDWVLSPNCWLYERGFLRFRGRASRWISRTLDCVKLRAVALLPAKVKRALYRFSRRQLGSIETRVRYGMIDWSGTQAYFEENPYHPVLWVNLKGRQPGGIVERGDEYEALRDRLIEELHSWRHPETGEPIVEKAYRREEIYSGPEVSDAADIIPKWGLHRGYSYGFKVSSKSPRLAWIEQVDPRKPANLQFFTAKSGHHRDDGILAAAGPGIRPGPVSQKARIIDLAPTILCLQGVAAPDDMDGRVLEDLIGDVPARPLSDAAPIEPRGGPPAEDGPVYSAEDEAMIAQRLRSLGYID